MVLDENSTDTPDCEESDKWVLEQINPETSLETKMAKLMLSIGHIMRRLVSLENRRQQKKEKTEYDMK